MICRNARLRARAALAALLVLVPVAACGRYGKPVRETPEKPPQEHAQSAEKR